jgi:hypothetical protein
MVRFCQKELAMDDGQISKRQRQRERDAEQKDRDVTAWLLIGAIFIGTMLAVWIPILFNAMHS